MPNLSGGTIERLADLYYTQPDGFGGDTPEFGVTPECDPETCPDAQGTCPTCAKPMCETHAASEQHVDTTPVRGCDGMAHESCHRQSCHSDCFEDPDDHYNGLDD